MNGRTENKTEEWNGYGDDSHEIILHQPTEATHMFVNECMGRGTRRPHQKNMLRCEYEQNNVLYSEMAMATDTTP